jgi:hypothetical protein
LRLKRLVILLACSVLVPFPLAACGVEGNDEESTARPGASQPTGTVAPTVPEAGRSHDGEGSGAPASARRTPGPSIAIIKPTDGETVRGRTVTVSVSVKGFKVVDQKVRPPFPPPVAGEGHVHFYLDTATLPTTHSPPTTGAYRSVSGSTYSWTGVVPGRHSLAVQLVGRDHTPLSRPVKDRIVVNVK